MAETPEQVRIQHLEDQVKALNEHIADIEKRDQQRMRAAILALAGVVLAMGSFIWAKIDMIVTEVLRGRP
jgi:hypothetical protein